MLSAHCHWLQDFANPEVVKHMQFYPEETDGPISEIWQAGRWKEFSPSELTPMFARGLQHFYIDEVCQLHDGSFAMPLTWVKRGGKVCADCCMISPAEVFPRSCNIYFPNLLQDGWHFVDGAVQSIPSTSFLKTYPELLASLGGTIPWSGILIVVACF